ncbi:MAG: hypothetical protein K8R53_07920 [Bacteroidales bacterium]|nr:hypothetical protein [Bacteroidales bacterium]
MTVIKGEGLGNPYLTNPQDVQASKVKKAEVKNDPGCLTGYYSTGL